MLILAVAVVLAIALPVTASEIHDAAAEGDDARVKELLKENPELALEKDVRNETVLHIAAREGHLEVVKAALKAGAPIDIGDNEGSTPLDVAAIFGHMELAEYLVKKGAAIDHADVNGLTPLHFAAYNEQPEITAFLIERGADVSALTAGSSTPLHGAAYNGDVATMTVLLENGADPNARNSAGYTPILSGAAVNGGLDAIELLVAHGADIYDRVHEGSSALMFAAAAGKPDLVRYFLEAGVPPDARNNHEWMAIHTAAEGGNVEIIDILVENGADVNAGCGFGRTAVTWAVLRSHQEATARLLELGADPDPVDDWGGTPLARAFLNGDIEIARLLISAGADVNRPAGDWERSILHTAAVSGRTDLIALAVEFSADVNAVDAYGMTPIEYAARYGHKDAADALIAAGARAEGLEENYGRPELLDQRVADGEAVMWYLGHCGFAVKTRDHFMVFDYWKDDDAPASASLSNGHIVASELDGQNVVVFVTHGHGDHFDPRIFDWADSVGKIEYVYGFRPELTEPYRTDGYEGPEYQFIGPREQATFGDVEVRTIEANDGGVGFLVSVDGIVLYHAGDHAGWAEGERDGYFAEIDYLDPFVDELDLAFVNVTGCHAHDPDRLREGNLYTMEKLKPAVVVPTHAFNREYAYADAAVEFAEAGCTTPCCLPVNCGDSFVYSSGRVAILAPAIPAGSAMANATVPTCAP
jgi:ankyrin repeat protein/L-ascorbate metabolism protein UlaG (beta-lactamase superfamily)